MRRLRPILLAALLTLTAACDDDGGGHRPADDTGAVPDAPDAPDAQDAPDASDALDADTDIAPVDECVTGAADCSPNAACHDLPAGYECVCEPGAAGNGRTCAPLALTAVVTSLQRSCASADDGTLRCWGLTLDANPIRSEVDEVFVGRPRVIESAGDAGWQQLDMSDAGLCGVRADGSLWCSAASGAQGVVGADSDWTSVSTGSVGGLGGGCGVRGGGQLWCWNFGFNPGNLVEPTTLTQLEPDSTWTAVALGATSACAVRDDGTLWCWGDNGGGQLGVGDTMRRDAPTRVGTATDWVSVTVAREHACGLRGGGQLWCWGRNAIGEVGDASRDTRTAPVAVDAQRSWRQVETSDLNTCAVADDGTLWCWGANTELQLGVETLAFADRPTQVGTDSDWVQVAPAASHTCAVRVDGSAWCWGIGRHGQLGLGLAPTQTRPALVAIGADWRAIAAGAQHTCGLRPDGPWCWGSGTAVAPQGQISRQDVPMSMELADDFVSLDSGTDNTCAVADEGTLWCWGANTHGEAGIGTVGNTQGPKQVTAPADWQAVDLGGTHTCALTADGSAWCWGNDDAGQLGDGGTTTGGSSSPVAVGAQGSFVAISAGGSLAGAGHTCAIGDDASLSCWGNNDAGQLGDGSTTSRDAPVAVAGSWEAVSAGARHTCGVQTDGSLWCWGEDDAGQLGLGTTSTMAHTPMRVGTDSDWTRVAAGGAHTCGLRDDGALFCWGNDGVGQLGNDGRLEANLPTPQPVEPGTVWLAVSTSRESTCAVRSDHSAWCWGKGEQGQGGHDMTFAPTPERVRP